MHPHLRVLPLALGALLLASPAMAAGRGRPVFVAARAAAKAPPKPAPTVAPAPAPTPARDPEEAKLLDSAKALERKRDFVGALATLQKAQARRHDAVLLGEVARLEEATGDVAGAYRDLERFMEEVDDAPPAKREEATAALRRLSVRVAWLSIGTAVPGAEVAVDGATAGRTPVLMVVRGGTHRVALMQNGALLGQQIVEAPVTSTISVNLEAPLPPEPTPIVAEAVVAPPTLTKGEAAPPSEPSPAGPWIAWSLTAGLVGATVITGVAAASRASSYERLQNTFGVSHAQLEAAQSDARSFAIAAGVLGGATVLAGVVAAVVTFGAPNDDARPRVSIGPGNVTLAGRF